MTTDRAYPEGHAIAGTVYKVVRVLGVGGMGTVYDVEDVSIGKRYVLKTLHPELGARPDLVRRLKAEARTLARLNHPNIVDVMTAGVTEDDLQLPYYVMERLNGQNLRIVLEKKGTLELSHAYHIAIDLLDALDHAHDKGVIHRDVKPDNLFLHRGANGVTVTKLLDFGIMSLLDGGKGETGGRFVGTLRYAAPEQIRGESPTPKMDLYAAALVLFEMITGRGPFDDEGGTDKIGAAHLSKEPPFLSQFEPGVPKALDLLVHSALAKEPARRPRDAFAFAAQLRNCKKTLQAARSPESTGARRTVSAVVTASAPPSSAPSQGRTATVPTGATLLGMAPPTEGQALGDTEPLPHHGDELRATEGPPTAVEAGIPTGTFTPEGANRTRSDTIAFGSVIPSARPPAFDLTWPEARPAAPSSQDGHAHTKPEPGRGGALRTAIVLFAIALLGTLAVGSSAFFIFPRTEKAAASGAVSPPPPPTNPAEAVWTSSPSTPSPTPSGAVSSLPSFSTVGSHRNAPVAAPSRAAAAAGVPTPKPALSAEALTPSATPRERIGPGF